MVVQLSLDDILIYVGCYIVTTPFVLVSLYNLPENLRTPILAFVMALFVAVPVAFLYRQAGKSLGDLGTFIFVTAALFMISGFSLTIAAGTFDAVPGTETLSKPPITFVVLAIVYAGGYYLVYRDGYARLKSTVVESV